MQLWKPHKKRLRERSKSSGPKNAAPFGARLSTVSLMGWVEGPFEITSQGRLAFSEMITSTRIRIGATRKLRLCGDLWANMVNLCTSVVAPITLPTWGNIAQLIKSVYRTKSKWDPRKADIDSSYIKLLFDPDIAPLTVVSLREPTSGRRRAFSPSFFSSDPPRKLPTTTALREISRF